MRFPTLICSHICAILDHRFNFKSNETLCKMHALFSCAYYFGMSSICLRNLRLICVTAAAASCGLCAAPLTFCSADASPLVLVCAVSQSWGVRCFADTHAHTCRNRLLAHPPTTSPLPPCRGEEEEEEGGGSLKPPAAKSLRIDLLNECLMSSFTHVTLYLLHTGG